MQFGADTNAPLVEEVQTQKIGKRSFAKLLLGVAAVGYVSNCVRRSAQSLQLGGRCSFPRVCGAVLCNAVLRGTRTQLS